MAKKKNLLPLILLSAGAIALMAFSKKRKGTVEVSPTEKITEEQFIEESELSKKDEGMDEISPVNNPIATAAGGAASRITELAEEATGTIETVEAAIEKSKAALKKPVSLLNKIKEKAAARRTGKAATAELKKQREAAYKAALAISQNPALPAAVRQTAAAQVAAYEKANPAAKSVLSAKKARRIRKKKISPKKRVKKIKFPRRKKLFGDGVPEII